MREITAHKVNGLNEVLTINVMDEPGHGGACHKYEICYSEAEGGGLLAGINFQNGPIKEFGVNGISGEALLAIVRDRLECFQRGPYACYTNGSALVSVIGAMTALASRTKERVERGVEGTNVV